MRIPTYFSPSSLCQFEKDLDVFYRTRMAEKREERDPQTPPMAVGSAFDARVKHNLVKDLQLDDPDREFEFDYIFESQVEPQNRDFALVAGQYCFDSYCYCGAYESLRKDLERSPRTPIFESSVKGEIGGVPMLGKPDLLYATPANIDVVLDWKVNGYCSTHGVSPYKGFKWIRDGWNPDLEAQTKSHCSRHKQYLAMMHGDIEIAKHYMDFTNKDWADQLATYGWLIGLPVGSEQWVARIEQLACQPSKNLSGPRIRVATHSCRISKAWQETLIDRYQRAWEVINSDHLFRHLSIEDSKKHQESLEEQAKILATMDHDEEGLVRDMRAEDEVRKTRVR